MTEALRPRLTIAAGLLLALSAPAAAEPHFSVLTGLRCSRCHVTPTGGGKRTAYGALFAQSQLTLAAAGPRSFSPSGAGASRGALLLPGLATGEITEWLAIGADLRLANTTTFADERKNSFEASQGTLYLELRPWPGHIVLYLDEEVAAGGARNREAWGMIRGPFATYLRGGRLYPPFGLRILDDAAYTRRSTGVSFANPDLGLEAGFDLGPLSVALAVTNGNFGSTDNDVLKAFWGLAEVSFPWARLGVSALFNPGEAGNRAMGGLHGGVRLARLLLQAEADLIAERPADSARWGYGLAGLVELDLVLTKGLYLSAAWDIVDSDLQVKQDRRQRFRFGLDFFPLRMVEVKVHYVLRQSETVEPLDAADLLEAMLHVYL